MQHENALSNNDLAIAAAIAALLALLFAWLSPGIALLVTFVPGLAVAWGLMAYLKKRAWQMPAFARVIPVYLITISVQFLHFTEEFGTGFQTRFGPVYGGGAIPDWLFVLINMASYAVFLLAPLGVWVLGRRFLLLPMLFFVIYGALGNAIAHSMWGLLARGYFPGLFTAQLYWVLGPLVLHRMGMKPREITVLVAVFAIILTLTAGLTADVAALATG